MNTQPSIVSGDRNKPDPPFDDVLERMKRIRSATDKIVAAAVAAEWEACAKLADEWCRPEGQGDYRMGLDYAASRIAEAIRARGEVKPDCVVRTTEQSERPRYFS